MNKAKAIEQLIIFCVIVTFIRGLFVFDLGGSAKDSYPVASAICLIGSIISAILIYYFRNKEVNK